MRNVEAGRMEKQTGHLLRVGDVIPVALDQKDLWKAGEPNVNTIYFVIMPYFWQGSVNDSRRRLRYVTRAALAAVQDAGHSSVLLPCLGTGLYGYLPEQASEVVVEEGVEALLQLDRERPVDGLRSITFVDAKEQHAQVLANFLSEVSSRFLPERQL